MRRRHVEEKIDWPLFFVVQFLVLIFSIFKYAIKHGNK